jgi:hypothetical protein
VDRQEFEQVTYRLLEEAGVRITLSEEEMEEEWRSFQLEERSREVQRRVGQLRLIQGGLSERAHEADEEA